MTADELEDDACLAKLRAEAAKFRAARIEALEHRHRPSLSPKQVEVRKALNAESMARARAARALKLKKAKARP